MTESTQLTRKEQVAIAATELFRQKGYKAASMRDLATLLGIEAASLYSHIKSKEEILRSICFRLAHELFNALDQADEKATTSYEKLRLAIEAHCVVLTRDTASSAVFLNEWRHLSEPFLQDFLKMREDYENRFLSIVRAGILNGEFSAVDEKLTVLTILSSLNWIHHWYKPNGKMTSTEISAQIASLLLKGLAEPVKK